MPCDGAHFELAKVNGLTRGGIRFTYSRSIRNLDRRPPAMEGMMRRKVDPLTSARAEVSRRLPVTARQRGAFAKRACGLAALLILAVPRIAAAQPVDLSLVLAVDVSGSIDAKRYDLQQEGLATAFSSDAVITAIRSGEHQRIAVTVVEWSGPTHQLQAIPWTVIEDAPGARAFASAIAALPRAYA